MKSHAAATPLHVQPSPSQKLQRNKKSAGLESNLWRTRIFGVSGPRRRRRRPVRGGRSTSSPAPPSARWPVHVVLVAGAALCEVAGPRRRRRRPSPKEPSVRGGRSTSSPAPPFAQGTIWARRSGKSGPRGTASPGAGWPMIPLGYRYPGEGVSCVFVVFSIGEDRRKKNSVFFSLVDEAGGGAGVCGCGRT